MPNTVRCPNGHFFDLMKFQVCPYCGVPASAPQMPPMQPMQPMPPMQPMQPMQPMPPMPPMPAPQGYYQPVGMPLQPPVVSNDEKTVSASMMADSRLARMYKGSFLRKDLSYQRKQKLLWQSCYNGYHA